MKISNSDLNSFANFAFFPNFDSRGRAESEGTIFSPSDNAIEIYRTNDFEKIGEMRCSIVTSQTSLYKCDAGILAWDGNDVALLNKK